MSLLKHRRQQLSAAVGYTLNCSNTSVSDDLNAVTGTTTTINGETVLSTGINGFGIHLTGCDTANAPVALAGVTGYRLTLIRAGFEAVPVKQSGTQLTASGLPGSSDNGEFGVSMKRFALCLFGCYCGIAVGGPIATHHFMALTNGLPPACAISDRRKPLKLSFVTYYRRHQQQ